MKRNFNKFQRGQKKRPGESGTLPSGERVILATKGKGSLANSRFMSESNPETLSTYLRALVVRIMPVYCELSSSDFFSPVTYWSLCILFMTHMEFKRREIQFFFKNRVSGSHLTGSHCSLHSIIHN